MASKLYVDQLAGSGGSTITLEDYPTILLAIKAKWIAFMQAKWSVKDNLNSISLTTSTARAEMDLVDLTTDLDAS